MLSVIPGDGGSLSKGLGAVKTLCDRFDLAIVEHDTRDSAVFLHSLESMRDMRVGDVGSALARADLKGRQHPAE